MVLVIVLLVAFRKDVGTAGVGARASTTGWMCVPDGPA